MSLQEKSQGFVLRKRVLPQKDVVVVLFTREYGKIAVIAKGMRSQSSSRSAHVQTGNIIEIVTRPSSGTLSYLQQTSLISAYQDIKNDMAKMKYVYAVLFVLDHILPEREPEPEIYSDTLSFMKRLHVSNTNFASLTEQYLIGLLRYLGYDYKQRNTTQDIIEYTEQLIDAKIPLHDII